MKRMNRWAVAVGLMLATTIAATIAIGATSDDEDRGLKALIGNETLYQTVRDVVTKIDDVTATATELNGLDKTQVGTAGTGVVAVEHGSDYSHVTVLTLTDVAYTIGDNAALADGALIYTFPAGEVIVESCTMQIALSLTTGTPTTDTPEICLGTVIATGAVATCGTTATFEDIAGPDVATNMAGAVNVLTQLGPTADNAGLVIADAAAHTLHLNIADTWANVDDTAATASGTVICKWSWFGNPA